MVWCRQVYTPAYLCKVLVVCFSCSCWCVLEENVNMYVWHMTLLCCTFLCTFWIFVRIVGKKIVLWCFAQFCFLCFSFLQLQWKITIVQDLTWPIWPTETEYRSSRTWKNQFVAASANWEDKFENIRIFVARKPMQWNACIFSEDLECFCRKLDTCH